MVLIAAFEGLPWSYQQLCGTSKGKPFFSLWQSGFCLSTCKIAVRGTGHQSKSGSQPFPGICQAGNHKWHKPGSIKYQSGDVVKPDIRIKTGKVTGVTYAFKFYWHK